jgi:predicted DsbA family dithiol-disulfide isomerase
MHDVLFASAKILGTLELGILGAKAQLDASEFTRCLRGDSADAVRRDASTANQLGITGTPTFLFGALNAHGELRVTRLETGAIPFAAFEGFVKELIAGAAPQPAQ